MQIEHENAVVRGFERGFEKRDGFREGVGLGRIHSRLPAGL
jgi:hypothetical protein